MGRGKNSSMLIRALSLCSLTLVACGGSNGQAAPAGDATAMQAQPSASPAGATASAAGTKASAGATATPTTAASAGASATPTTSAGVGGTTNTGDVQNLGAAGATA